MLLPVSNVSRLRLSSSIRAADEGKRPRPSFARSNKEPFGQSFDLLARALAGGLSRRRALMQLGSFVVADLIGRPLRITSAAAQALACNPTELNQCYQTAQLDYDRCGLDCPANSSNCQSTCEAGLTLGRQKCDVQFGLCASGTVCCDGACTNASNDPRNCGTCGNVCGNEACTNGVCGCPAGFTACGTVCNNLSNDPQHCGSCGTVCRGPAQSTPICRNGTCDFVCNDDLVLCRSSCCPAGAICCDGTCTNLTDDAQNCGACGKVCAGGEVCRNKVCAAISCDRSQLRQCYGNVQSDYYACSDNCPADSSQCRSGCFAVLARGRHNCDLEFGCPEGSNCCGGICTNPMSDPQNCGACGHICPAPPNSTGTCTYGRCEPIRE
jgi:Stigma-specific protein, Stig1